MVCEWEFTTVELVSSTECFFLNSVLYYEVMSYACDCCHNLKKGLI